MSMHYKNISVKEMCSIMGVNIMESKKSLGDLQITHTCLAVKRIKPGSAYIMLWDDVSVKATLDLALSKGASVLFVERRRFKEGGLNEDDYPVIFLTDWLSQVGRYFSTVRKSYPATTVAITGTVGKTTTNQFLTAITKSHFKTYSSPGNTNSFYATAEHIMKNTSDDLDIYIQECGAATFYSVEKAAAMLQPDIFVLMNVKDHHLNTYKTFSNLFYDKTSIDRHMGPLGVVITNYDDEAIAAHRFQHRVVSFGIETDREVDYRAVNIVEKDGRLDFDIVSYGESVHISIAILGKHNVYNALAAYVAGKELRVPKKKIIDSFKDYSTKGIRQNYKNIGGYHLYVDCYNVAFASIRAGLDSMENFTLDENARRFAVVGGENKLGLPATEWSFEFGKTLHDCSADHLYCYGRPDRSVEGLDMYGDARSIHEGLRSIDCDKSEFIEDQDTLIERLSNDVKRGDMVLFKGIYLLDMPIAIDKVFGTSFVASSEYYQKDAKIIEDGDFYYREIPFIKDVELKGPVNELKNVEIPDQINGRPVYRIKGSAFYGKTSVESLKIGKNIINIGALAFAKCSGLKQVDIPSNVLVIEAAAFRLCTGLEMVELADGVRHISKNAFRGCSKLKKISLPESIGNIGESVFENCPELVIYCKENSYADWYAKENNLNVCYI